MIIKILKRLNVGIKNIGSLVKTIFSKDIIFWGGGFQQAKDSRFHSSTKIYPPYSFVSVEIGDSTYINRNSFISYTKIGKFCSIGPNLICGWGIHPTDGISTSPVFYSSGKNSLGYTFAKEDKIVEREQIVIGNDVFIGANVTILDGVTIGDGAVIGAGAVVSKDIPAYAIAVGCPIKVIKYRFPKEVIDDLLRIKWWDQEETTLSLLESEFYDVRTFISKIDNQEL